MSSLDILVPDLPESVADATVATWHKKPGDSVKRDDVLVEIETDKVILEVPAAADGIMEAVLEQEGATVTSRQLLGRLKEGVQALEVKAETTPSQQTAAATEEVPTTEIVTERTNDSLSPTARRLLAEHDLDPKTVKGTGVGGRITRQDIDDKLAQQAQLSSAQVGDHCATATANTLGLGAVAQGNRFEKRVPMTRLRKRVAERLLEAKNNTAMLTTFNEVNMQPIMQLRKKYGKAFEERHGVRLGFMSFYVKAVVQALKHFPEINASIDGEDIIYRDYFDISIAVSTPRGLVTPVLRNAEMQSMAEIENTIKQLAIKGQNNKLQVDELTGGNFTITNGGVFGSLMSTPIINPPQSAILGMHAIKERPMAVEGKVEILPMMYLALSYDHRLIDGRESVGFLVMVKELLEDPTRLVMEV